MDTVEHLSKVVPDAKTCWERDYLHDLQEGGGCRCVCFSCVYETPLSPPPRARGYLSVKTRTTGAISTNAKFVTLCEVVKPDAFRRRRSLVMLAPLNELLRVVFLLITSERSSLGREGGRERGKLYFPRDSQSTCPLCC